MNQVDTISSAVERAKKNMVFQEKIISDKEVIYKNFEIEKQKIEPYMIVPDENETYKYTCQHHYRGKTAHVDFRVESEKKEFLIGWTWADLIQDAITEPVSNMNLARKWDKNPKAWKVDWQTGKFLLRKTRAGNLVPAEIRAFEKATEPHEWLSIEGVTRPWPAPGSTKQYRGVFSIVDEGICEYGTQKLDFHEYFLSKGKIKGRIAIRRISRSQFAKDYDIDDFIIKYIEILNDTELEKQEVILPPGTPEERVITDTFWVVIQPIDQMPYAITKRAIEKNWMPSTGKSALPRAIREQIPEEFHYWKTSKSSEARKKRDALVEAIDKEEVKIDLEVLTKGFDPEEIEKQESGKFVLQFHWWRGPIVVRRGASVYHFDFRAYFGKIPFDHWVLEEHPQEYPGGVSATEKPCKDKETMDVEYNPPPKGSPYSEYKKQSIPFNSPLNPTKATPAFIQSIDKGKVIKLIDEPMFKKYQVFGGKMKGLWIVERTDPKTPHWIFRKSELPETKK